MRNSQYESRIYQKSYNKVTMRVYVWFDLTLQCDRMLFSIFAIQAKIQNETNKVTKLLTSNAR